MTKTYKEVMSNWDINLTTPQDVAYQGEYKNGSGDYYLQSSSFYKKNNPYNVHITVSLQNHKLSDLIEHFHISVEFSTSGGGLQNVPIYFNHNGTKLRTNVSTKGKLPEVEVAFLKIYNDIKPEIHQMAIEFFNKYAVPPSPVTTVV